MVADLEKPRSRSASVRWPASRIFTNLYTNFLECPFHDVHE
jgi:hypothetical protein